MSSTVGLGTGSARLQARALHTPRAACPASVAGGWTGPRGDALAREPLGTREGNLLPRAWSGRAEAQPGAQPWTLDLGFLAHSPTQNLTATLLPSLREEPRGDMTTATTQPLSPGLAGAS